MRVTVVIAAFRLVDAHTSRVVARARAEAASQEAAIGTPASATFHVMGHLTSRGSPESHWSLAVGILADSFVIAVKSPIVIGKRMAIFAKGGRSAKAEATTAVTEKANLAAGSTVSLASGNSLASVVKRYRQRVEANSRRL